MFRKDVYLDEKDWSSPRLWDGDVRDPNTKTPYELACHHALMQVPGLDSVIGMRETLGRGLIDNREMRYRMYLEWAPYGDLHELIEAYRNAPVHHIPEPMLWYTFLCLAECGLAMDNGHVNSQDPEKDPGWRDIVHR